MSQSLFYNKVAGLRPANLLKKRLAQVFSCEFIKFQKIPFLQNTYILAPHHDTSKLFQTKLQNKKSIQQKVNGTNETANIEKLNLVESYILNKCTSITLIVKSAKVPNLKFQIELVKLSNYWMQSNIRPTGLPSLLFYTVDIYSFKGKKKTVCEISSKLKIKIPQRRRWYLSGIIIANFE